MQFKTLILSTVFAVASTQALILNTPVSVVTGEPLKVSFEGQPGDSDFTLLLENVANHEDLALVSVVDPNQRSVTIDFPCVPAEG